MARGKLQKAAKIFKQAIREGEHTPSAGWAHLFLSTIYFEWNDLVSAAHEIERAIEISQFLENQFQELVSFYAIGIRLAQGDMAGAEKALEQADSILDEIEASPPNLARNAAAHVVVSIAHEDQKSTSHWLDKLSDFEAVLPPDIPPIVLHLLFNMREKAAAAKRWQMDYQQAAQKGFQRTVISTLVLQALNAPTPENALTFLAEALTKGKSEGFVRLFTGLGISLVPLLRHAIAAGIEPEYAHRLMVIIQTEGRRSTPSYALLSEREIVVLKLVAEGLSNRQIADKLIISLSTAKSHLYHLFDKLNAKDRLQAVTRARELKLI